MKSIKYWIFIFTNKAQAETTYSRVTAPFIRRCLWEKFSNPIAIAALPITLDGNTVNKKTICKTVLMIYLEMQLNEKSPPYPPRRSTFHIRGAYPVFSISAKASFIFCKNSSAALENTWYFFHTISSPEVSAGSSGRKQSALSPPV